MKLNIRYFKSILILCTLLAVFAEFSTVDLMAARRRKPAKPKVILPPSHVFLQDTILSPGIIYKRITLSINGDKHDVHILQADLKDPECELKVLKANRNISDLSKLQDIVKYFDSVEQTKIKGAVNANFWKAYTNYPIGPVIVDGEIVEMLSYKEWSSMFINDYGLPFIDNFKISGSIVKKKMQEFNISCVNRRKDTNGIVLYNRFGGSVIPHVNARKTQELLTQTLENQTNETDFNDSTEAEFDLETMQAELIEMERAGSIEFGLPKLTLNYLSLPSINKNIYVAVTSIDTHAVKMPENGCIASFGKDFKLEYLPKVGDTLLIRFNTNVHRKENFSSAVCGTPRLVRNGAASHEAKREGSTGRRFISHKLPRTAVGYNRAKDKLFIVAIKGNCGSQKTSGANLSQLASIMKYIGCYNAMNLDGGGSTLMVIDGKNVINEDNPNSSRRISVGLGLSSEYSFERFINEQIVK